MRRDVGHARWYALGGIAAVAALAGCGFQPAGRSVQLPPAMHKTFIASSAPYGHLENLLRRAILADGNSVAEDSRQATGVLYIMDTRQERRVLAVDSQGRPVEFAVTYLVQYRLENAAGNQLLAPTTIKLRRDLAYSVNIELGAGRRQQQLLEDMQREASRLILLRLEALGKHAQQPPKPASAPAQPAPAAET